VVLKQERQKKYLKEEISMTTRITVRKKSSFCLNYLHYAFAQIANVWAERAGIGPASSEISF
jgi:hypothetical protein